MVEDIRQGNKPSQWAVTDGLITYNGRIFVSSSSPLLLVILELAHDVGHEGTQKTLAHIRADFPRGSRPRHCPRVCSRVSGLSAQQNRTASASRSTAISAGPLSCLGGHCHGFHRGTAPSSWQISDTVVDRFSKFAHFIPLAHPYTATTVAASFFAEIVRFHGIPASIVSNRNPVFTRNFLGDLFRLAGVQLNFTSAFHPQSDGQSEVTNKIIAMYLQCLTGDRPRQWLRCLPWAEFCYNTSYQTSLRTSPFQVVYGRQPLVLRSYDPGSARLPAVQQSMQERDEFIMAIRERLKQVQQQYKSAYDRCHREVEYAVGDWVWLRLLHQPIASLNVKGRGKLGPKFYGPYEVVERIGLVAYRLCLPPLAKLHNVFHVGLLKPFRGTVPDHIPPLPPTVHGRACLEPECVL